MFSWGRDQPTQDNVPYDGKLTFVRLRYTLGPGAAGRRGSRGEVPWAHDYPTSDIHMMKILNELTTVSPRIDGSNVLSLGDPELFNYPIAYMSEPGFWAMDDDEALALALYVRSTSSLAGPRAAVDSIAASGRAVIGAVDTTTLDDASRALLRRHAEELARGTTLTRRAETLARWEAAVLGAMVLLAAALLVTSSVVFVRNWSAQVSAPVEELVDWTRRIQRGEPLPPVRRDRVAPELAALRDALREMAAALDQARHREIERERLQAFRETARRVAHEMRGPLNAAQLALGRWTEQAGPNSDEARRVLEEETERLRRMADSFAAFGRLPEGPESEIDVTELMESVLTATVPPECPIGRSLEPGLMIRGRYEALRRAVQNVVRNAVQATDGRGIAVSAARAREGSRGPGAAGERNGSSPWAGWISTSVKPRRSRWLRSRRCTRSGVRSGTSRKSSFADATAGRTVFVPGPEYPEVRPQIVQVGWYRFRLTSWSPDRPSRNWSSPRSRCSSFGRMAAWAP